VFSWSWGAGIQPVLLLARKIDRENSLVRSVSMLQFDQERFVIFF
jgi:hypothetical protein